MAPHSAGIRCSVRSPSAAHSRPRLQKLALLLHHLKHARTPISAVLASARQRPPGLLSGRPSFLICGGCHDVQQLQPADKLHCTRPMLTSSEDQLSADAYWHSLADAILLERHQLYSELASCSRNARDDVDEDAEIVPSSTDTYSQKKTADGRGGENPSFDQQLQDEYCTQGRQLGAGERRRLNTTLDDSPSLAGRASAECAPKPEAAHPEEDVGPLLSRMPLPACSSAALAAICTSPASTEAIAGPASVSLLTLLQEESFSSLEYSSFEWLEAEGTELQEANLTGSCNFIRSPQNVYEYEHDFPLQLLCCVCMERHKGAAIIPCGHTFCRSCPKHLTACPLCKSPIVQVLDIF
ncbi:hypothetical protein L7F22_031806 [Adiantum nelumboides]|nr:hypothetical protein [Adiantum nelumboides]